jgi:hypothetical protein
MSINIFNILLEPSKESENILKESNEKKIQIIVISLVLLGLVSRIYIST